MNERAESGWFTRERMLTALLAMATLLALYTCFLIIQPFFPALVFALALSVATQRPYGWLRGKLGNDTAAAAVGVVLVTLLIVGPVTGLVVYLVQQAIDSLNALQQSGIPNWQSWVEQHRILSGPYAWLQQHANIQAQVQGLAKSLAGQAGGFLAGFVNFGTELVITLFVLFFLYRDRASALRAFRHLMPLSSGETSRLFRRINDTILATVNGSMTVAFVQAAIAGLMYWFLGVPLAVVWAAATFIMALLPVFGTFTIWGPISVYLLLSGSWGKAAILAGWGMCAVGTIDNLLYPYLVGDRLRMHTVPTFFAILGGISLFGAAGLILGPVTLAVTVGLLDIWWCRTESGEPAEESVDLREQEKRPEKVLQERKAQPD